MRRKRGVEQVTGSTKTSIDVLLAENVETLGSQGDVVRVKPGFARNFLLPQGLATIASEQNKFMVKKHRERLEQLEVDRARNYKKLAEQISKYSVTIEANANPDGHLYGSIVDSDISKKLTEAGYDVEPEHIKLVGPLKELGMYTVKVELHPKARSEVKVWVVPATSTAAS